MDLNVVVFSGHLGADPKMRYTPSGLAVTNMRLAVNIAKEKTLWFDVVAWGPLAENTNKYLVKGSHIAVNGRLDQDEWEGDDGVRRTSLKIVANDVRFLGGKKDGAAQESRVKPAPDGGDAAIDDLVEEGFEGIDDGEFPI